jgi:hypothetical protein
MTDDKPIILPSATEHELLERTKALWTADIALAKGQGAKIESQSAARLAELLAGHEPEAAA